MCEVRDAIVCAGRAVLHRSPFCRFVRGDRSRQSLCIFFVMRGGSAPVHAMARDGLLVLVCPRSTPPRVGAVLLAADGKMSYTDCAPPAEILEQFHTRNDNQIASLEMLAIAYGERCAP